MERESSRETLKASDANVRIKDWMNGKRCRGGRLMIPQQEASCLYIYIYIWFSMSSRFPSSVSLLAIELNLNSMLKYFTMFLFNDLKGIHIFY